MKLTKKFIEEEFRDTDGYWIYLKPGWKNDLDPLGNLHIISEDTKAECYRCGVLPCDCDDCKKYKEKNMKTFTIKDFEKFTREMFLTLTPDEVVEYWKQRNRWLRDQGKPHFTELLDGKTFKKIASI